MKLTLDLTWGRLGPFELGAPVGNLSVLVDPGNSLSISSAEQHPIFDEEGQELALLDVTDEMICAITTFHSAVLDGRELIGESETELPTLIGERAGRPTDVRHDDGSCTRYLDFPTRGMIVTVEAGRIISICIIPVEAS